MTEKKLNIALSIAKMAVHARGLLEAQDELSNTNIYKHKVKLLAGRLEAELTKDKKVNTDNEFANEIIQNISMSVDDVFAQYKEHLLLNVKKVMEVENK